MICDKCKTDLNCPCEHCSKKNSESRWIWVDEDIKCPECGHQDHEENWDSR